MKKKDKPEISEVNQQVFRIAVASVAEAFDVNESDIVASRRRHDRKAKARQMTYWLMRKGTALSSIEIGALFSEPKDHATILNGEKVMEGVFEVGDIPENPFYKNSIKAANLFNKVRREHIIARRKRFEEKIGEIIND